jgi:hypothetical protein
MGEPSSVLIAANVPLDETNREGAEPGAERDQRPLRPEHHAQAQGGKGREHDAGKVAERWRPFARLKPVGWRTATLAGQVPDREPNEHASQQQRQNGPPQRLAVKAQTVGQAREDPALQFVDQRQEEVRRCRNGNANNGGKYQQRHIALGAQQRKRIGRWCRHQPLLTGGNPSGPSPK